MEFSTLLSSLGWLTIIIGITYGLYVYILCVYFRYAVKKQLKKLSINYNTNLVDTCVVRNNLNLKKLRKKIIYIITESQKKHFTEMLRDIKKYYINAANISYKHNEYTYTYKIFITYNIHVLKVDSYNSTMYIDDVQVNYDDFYLRSMIRLVQHYDAKVKNNTDNKKKTKKTVNKNYDWFRFNGDNTPPSSKPKPVDNTTHPKWEKYSKLLSNIKLRKVALKDMATDDINRAGHVNETNTAIRKAKIMKDKYNF